MQAIKQSSFFRPNSRPSSPAPTSPPIQSRPDSGVGIDVSVIPLTTRTNSRGPLNRLSLSSLRGRSPVAKDREPTPAATLVQDGSYLEALGLKISEAISKALAPVPCPSSGALPDDGLNGRRPLPHGRGSILSQCIASELQAAKEKPQLYKAIVRSLHRPMSVLITNLSGQLLPLLTSAKFLNAEPSVELNAAQLHALSVAGFAAEVLSTFDVFGLGLGGLTEARGDGLQGVREGLEGIVNRVLNPIMLNVKQDLLSIISDLEKIPSEPWLPNSKMVANGLFKLTPSHQSFHQSISALVARLPYYAKCLQRCQATCGKAFESQQAALLISAVWRALVAISNRTPKVNTASPPVTPSIGIKKRLTPPSTPRMTITFKGTIGASRPPSPTVLSVTRAADARAVYDILRTIPKPCESNVDACEAIEEAFDDLKALAVLLETLETFSGKIEDADLEILTEEIPTLITLPVLLTSTSLDTPADLERAVPSLLGMGEKEYRQACLTSFGREEETAVTVVRKLTHVLQERGASDSLLGRWLSDQMED